ncbi:D-hexose-6-phosphate mutarotase [Phycisphaerales bacterium AB-hyl4]|uniref:Putative glucose-6-phosphate 1-epimerase n=1 Tax=Natronomicrosphaera hydrolytica TaxID=3242702 RepID=A0ABV4U4L4_9BACT
MTKNATAQSLNEQFGIPETLRFEDPGQGMPRAVITADAATAVIYLHGAHIAEYQPTGDKPVLFMSPKSNIHPDKPIRGGIPICFPWFGPNQHDPTAPPHGQARLAAWQLTQATKLPDQRVQLTLTRDIAPFRLTFTITVGQELQMQLRTENTTNQPAQFEQALHTYFTISKIHDIEITGLAGLSYIDKTRNAERLTQANPPLRFEGETDRVYINHPGHCTLHDPGYKRNIVIEKHNANSTIVWNPWTDKSLKLPDLGDDDWPGFVCIESGNVADNAITLAPSEAHEMTATLRPQPQA